MIALEISSRNARVAALQKRWDRLRAGLDLILDKRGADMADLPGSASGLLVCDYKGKEADRLVTRIDPGVVSLVAELRGHERQAAEELEQWKTHSEERWVIEASPPAITLALLLTDEELDSLEKKAGDGEIARGGRPGDQLSQALNRLRAMASLPKSSRQCRGRRRATAVGWCDRLESEPPWQAVRAAAHRPIPLMGISHRESAAGVNPRFARFSST